MAMDGPDLFSDQLDAAAAPLADRMRPASLDEFVGQTHLLGEGKPLRLALQNGLLHSMIFWGPPGTGKTTLARLVTHKAGALFLSLSAVLSGVKDIRAAIDQARQARAQGQRSVLFVDEVHRFNKAQQDAFLPFVEDGTIIFIGATTENPSFEVNNALLSRARVYVLKALDEVALESIVSTALNNKKRGLGERKLEASPAVLHTLVHAADGDARRALNFLEIAADLAEKEITGDLLTEVVSGGVRRFDKGGEAFYDQISALHKSVRGSNPDAALYWLVRMIDGGCDPLYLARRIVRMASEDVGNADPRGLQLSLDAWDVQERLGSPEGELALAQAVVYLACAPKSNAVYVAFKAALRDIEQTGSLDVPLHLRNAPTTLMKNLDYGKGYRYAHDEPDGYAAGEQYFPDGMTPRNYYKPTSHGLEIKIRERLESLRAMDRKAGRGRDPGPGDKE